MGRLVILAGGSAAGKSYVLQNCDKIGKEYVKVKKNTTRPPRQNEDMLHSDLNYNCTRDEILKCEYRYLYGEFAYGISKKNIDNVLEQNKSPIVIVRRAQIIRELIKDYSNAVVIYCHSKLSKDELKLKLKELGHPDSEIADRVEKIEEDYLEYVNNFDLFSGVATNMYDDHFIGQIKRIIESYPTIDYKSITVLMDKEKENNLLPAIELNLSAVKGVDLAPYNPELAWFGEKEIKCIKAIHSSRLLMFDLSDASALEYYWLGRAKASRDVKDILVLAKKGTVLPFDIFDLKVYYYTDPIRIAKDILVPYFEAYCN